MFILGGAGTAHAQVFLGSRPDPLLTVGPLFVTATVTPGLGDVAMEIMWGLNAPATRSAAELEQTIYLLWPGEIVPDPAAGKADPALNRFIEQRGFTVVEDGRVPLVAKSAYQLQTDAPPEPIPGGAAFVTFVRQGGALGLTPPATYIRIPWHPKLANRAWLMSLRFQARGMLKPTPATWLESTFWGARHRFELSWHELRPRAVFPVYFEHRDRVLRLDEDPSQLIVDFTDADRLKIDEITPGTATRRRDETLERTEVVARYLEAGEGLAPQALTVQFGYFSGVQSWAPILIPILFFVLGNFVRPPMEGMVKKLGRTFVSRLAIGPRKAGPPDRESGVVLTREQLARIVPQQTTREQVLALARGAPEEFEQRHAPDKRTLIFRGRRVVPRRARRFGWVSAVGAWDVEHHEVEIELDRDVVQTVQARVRRAEMADPETA
ncbi:MAG: hypothetical protein FJ027_09915 [Candidatus Rokubacteria bacterium]|nr:hypothetical protein [Candidatus Rokubacteria bacterium]